MPSFLDNAFSAAELVPLFLAVVAVVLLLSSVRRRLRQHQHVPERSSPQREPPRDPPGSDTKQRLRRDLESLIVELQELSRRVSGEIDTRFAKLESAMHDADRRIAVLSRLSRGEGDAADDGQDDERAEPGSRYAIVYDLADAGRTPVEIARDLGKTPGEVELILNLRRNTQGTSVTHLPSGETQPE
jgi:hypothetical protein